METPPPVTKWTAVRDLFKKKEMSTISMFSGHKNEDLSSAYARKPSEYNYKTFILSFRLTWIRTEKYKRWHKKYNLNLAQFEQIHINIKCYSKSMRDTTPP